MKVVSWNVNSLRARLERVKDFVETRQPDVLCMQETKCKDTNFPELDLRALGYDVCHFGLSQYNGVAIMSKKEMTDIVSGLGADDEPYIADARVISARIDDTIYVNAYVPNGRDVESEHYKMKLTWYDHFHAYLKKLITQNENVIVVGDFNVAPSDTDVWDIDKLPMTTHITPKERNKVSAILDLGFTDSYRHVYPTEQAFTFWDYRGGDFHMNHGLRIDLALVSNALKNSIVDVSVDRDSRKGTKPSDHAALVLELK